jgi:antitoxin (DNA-binding transcriptional repressor) of toxin-antitoxin stability system
MYGKQQSPWETRGFVVLFLPVLIHDAGCTLVFLDNLSRKRDILTNKRRSLSMQTMTVGHFKSHFSQVLDLIQHGEDIVISYGKKKEKIAVLVPYEVYAGKPQRILGLLSGKASFSVSADFKTTDEELLSL